MFTFVNHRTIGGILALLFSWIFMERGILREIFLRIFGGFWELKFPHFLKKKDGLSGLLRRHGAAGDALRYLLT